MTTFTTSIGGVSSAYLRQLWRYTAIVCVYRTGGDYGVEHVRRLWQQVQRHAPGAQFVCLTDDFKAVLSDPELAGVCVSQLEHNWPGWWSKLEAFRLPGPMIYLDLDVSLTGDLVDPLLVAANDHELIACGNFWVEDPHRINSSVVAWRGDASLLYREFAKAPDRIQKVYKTREKWGDQAFIADTWPGEIATWQELAPGAVVSFKRGALRGEPLGNCRVLVSHGKPRPWEPRGADSWWAAHRAARPRALA